MRHPDSLEFSATETRQLIDAVAEHIVNQIRTLPGQPVDTSGEVSADLVRSFREGLPESGTDFDELLSLIFDKAGPAGLNPTSPGFMGYVPGGGLFHAALADLISNTLNRYVGVTMVAPIGYPEQARGFLTSGGSMATLSALITARHVRLGEDFSKAVIYLSDQIHHCVNKAARLAGFPASALHVLPADEAFRLDPDALRKAMEEDRSTGLEPFMIAASAGTTNTGAIDPLPELAALAREENLWLHVDAAYGGFFCLTKRGKQKLKGLELADSVVLDPHKSLFLPYGTGALLVREGRDLKATHSSGADYMPLMQEGDELTDFCELSPELTRPFRGLRVWLPMKMHGIGVFRDYLDEKLDLTDWIQQQIAQIPELEIIAPAELSIMAFALRDTFETLESRNAATRNLLSFINEQQRVNLTGTTVRGLFVIRIAVLVYRVHQERMEMLLEDLKAGLGAVVFGVAD
jgi:aromatic-L-amino-acid decarboxylase